MDKFFKKFLVGLFGLILVLFIFGIGVLFGSIFSPSGSSTTLQTGGNFATFEKVYEIMKNDFYFGKDGDEYGQKLISDAINGMVDAQGDIHTEYMTADELSSFTGSLESSFVGIGVTYTPLEESILVKAVIKAAPAEKAGVLPGDEIIAVDGTRLTKETVDSVADLIKGKKGTNVVLTIKRGNEQLDITVTRDEISNTVFSEYLGDGVGLLEITSFSDGTAKEVGNHLNDLKNKGTTKLIIDLRDNGGGYANTLDDISSYFMNKGDIIMREEDRNGKETIDYCKGGTKYEYEKIILLVNENSASCSEVFTLAMKENVGAVVVGETTYGKGIAQLTKLFADGSALKYTDQAWKSSSGAYVGGVGITPDYKVRLHEVLYQSYLVLSEGDEIFIDTVNENTAKVQLMLDFLGYDVDRTDGYFSEKTKVALEKYQADNALMVTGSINEQTANQLNSSVVSYWQNNKDTLDYQMLKAKELLK